MHGLNLKGKIMRALLLSVVSIVAFANSAVAQIENPFANVLKSPTELKVIENDDPQTVLLKKTFNASHREMRVRYNLWFQDIGDINVLLQSIERLHKFRLEIGPTTSEISFVEQKLAFAKELETHCEKANSKANFESIRAINEASANAFRIRAELELLKLTSAANTVPKK